MSILYHGLCTFLMHNTDTKLRGCDLLLLHRLWRLEYPAIQAMETTHRQEQASKSPTTADTDGGQACRP